MKNLLPLAWIFLERLAVEYAAVLFLATLDAVGSPCAPLLEGGCGEVDGLLHRFRHHGESGKEQRLL